MLNLDTGREGDGICNPEFVLNKAAGQIVLSVARTQGDFIAIRKALVRLAKTKARNDVVTGADVEMILIIDIGGILILQSLVEAPKSVVIDLQRRFSAV